MSLLHPMLVHFPIAFFILEFFLLLLWHFLDHSSYRDFAKLSFQLGVFFLLLSALSGYRDSGGLRQMSGEISRHFKFAALLLISSIAKAASEFFGPSFFKGKAVLVSWSSVNVLLVSITAFWGGWIVYKS